MRVVVILILLTTPAYAYDENSFTCKEVRAAVAMMGVKRTEQWARSMGASDQAIERARQCLKKRPGSQD